MKLLRSLSFVRSRALLAFALAALVVQALIPAGLMVAPSAKHGVQIVLCPQTHPLARALTAKSVAQVNAEMAAFHAAMGHGEIATGVTGQAGTSHTSAPDEPVPASSAAPAAQPCAFSGAGALAAMLPERGEAPSTLDTMPDLVPAGLKELRLAHPPRLRPPLRAPPVLI